MAVLPQLLREDAVTLGELATDIPSAKILGLEALVPMIDPRVNAVTELANLAGLLSDELGGHDQHARQQLA